MVIRKESLLSPNLSPHSGLLAASQRSPRSVGSSVGDADRSALGEDDATPPVLLLTIEEAAERLHVGRCTMQALLTSGEVQSLRIGRLRRIPPSALEDYIEREIAR